MEGNIYTFAVSSPSELLHFRNSEPAPRQIIEVLQYMRRTIAAGWVKGTFVSLRGMCMFGAYLHGSGITKDRHSRESVAVGELLERVIRENPTWRTEVPSVYHEWNLVVWVNDSVWSTHDDMLRILDRAIEIATESAVTGAPLEQLPGETVQDMLDFKSFMSAYQPAMPELVPAGVLAQPVR